MIFLTTIFENKKTPVKINFDQRNHMVTHVSFAFCRFCRSTLFRHTRKRCRPKFLPKHRSDSEHKDTSLKMRSKLPTQALPSKFSFHPKNIVRTPLQKMPTYVPKEKNTLKALESTGWSQYSRRTVLALQKYFSKWRCTKPNPKSRPPLLQSRSFLFWESKSKPAQALPMLSKNFQGLWQIASPRPKKAFSNVESDLRFQFPMRFLLSFIFCIPNRFLNPVRWPIRRCGIEMMPMTNEHARTGTRNRKIWFQLNSCMMTPP